MLEARQVTRALLVGAALAASAPAQGYLDGQEVIRLANASRTEEAFKLAREKPEAYGQWAALFLIHRIAPQAYSYSTNEGRMLGYEEACRHRLVNKEAEGLCYRGIIDVSFWRGYPEIDRLLTRVKLPNLTREEAQRGLARLESEGVPYAVFLNRVATLFLSSDPQERAKALEESRLRPLAEQYPFSLGGAQATGLLALSLWEREKYADAMRTALPVFGAIATAGAVVAWGEFTGTGIKENTQSACQRALFWTLRSLAPPAVYTLGLCYLEGVGGYPKDPVEAYALFWLGQARSAHPGFAKQVKELEATLKPNALEEGRRRAERYLR